MAIVLTPAQLHTQLQGLVEQAGSQTALARRLGITVQYLNDVLHGKRDIGAALAQRLGYQREIRYRKQEEKAT